jgi:hypothetical protein
MTTAGAQTLVDVTTITGNRITVQGHTCTTAVAAATVAAAVLAAVSVDVVVHGDIHGMLRFPFADEETLDGALQPADLKTAQIKLTQGGADAVVALMSREIYNY